MSHFFSNFITNLFDTKQEQQQHLRLLDYLESKFTDLPHDKIILIYSIAGLIARIAYSDLIIQASEQKMMEKELASWIDLDRNSIKEIVQLASQEMKLFAGSENHKFCSPLIDILSETERYNLIETLFKIANSDGEISPAEEQEIRVITQALGLPHRYFTAARAKIKIMNN